MIRRSNKLILRICIIIISGYNLLLKCNNVSGRCIEFVNASYFTLRIYLFIFTRYFPQDLSTLPIARKSLVLFYVLYNLLRMHVCFFPSDPNYPHLIHPCALRYRFYRLINRPLSFFVVITKHAAWFTNRRDASLSFMAGITAGIASRTGNDGVTPMARTRVHAPTVRERNHISALRACNPLHVSRYIPRAHAHIRALVVKRTNALGVAIKPIRPERPGQLACSPIFTAFLSRPTGSGEYRSFLSTYEPIHSCRWPL